MTSHRLAANLVDIVIDLGYIENTATKEWLVSLENRINSLPQLSDWRTVAIVGGSFPVDLRGHPEGISTIERREWTMFTQIKKGANLSRVPIFGDYGIQNPKLSEANRAGKANLRYTSGAEWTIFRGSMIEHRNPLKTISAQLQLLCKVVKNNSVFCGSDFSGADEYIAECADGHQVASNSLTTWKQVCFNHHITYVSHQVAK